MSNTDILYLIIIAILALGIAVFQYFYKAKTSTKKRFVFAFLRFMSLFLLGVLLLNPTFKQTKLTNIKPNLVIAVDNSKSIQLANQQENTKQFLAVLKQSKLSDKFNIDYYSFGKEINEFQDSLTFDAVQTNISKVFTSFKEIYTNTQAPTILLTDGNQTYGQDYIVPSLTYKQPIYPVVLGDSILKTDLNIKEIQHNRYTFLKNEFPVEITLGYIGKTAVSEHVTIHEGKSKVYTKLVSFSEDNNTQVLQLNLPATRIGKQKYSVSIEEIPHEENTTNNTRNFSVEVIDERTNVLLISDMLHPDLGAFKKAIETNQQRKVTITKPNDQIVFNNYQLVVLYQPSRRFKKVFDQLELLNKNYLTITGLQTDWDFLNGVQQRYKKTVLNQSQEYQGRFNNDFDLFQYDELSVSTLPPLESLYGDVQLNNNSHVLLRQNINGIESNTPLLSFFEDGNRREALLSGEGIWRWRAKSYLNHQSFEKFDAFVGKIVQYLASNTKKERLVIDVTDEFLLGEAKITAQYFDKNYVLDANATISCKLTNQNSKKEYNYNFLYKNKGYELNLEKLPKGNYIYVVSVAGKDLRKSGSFEIINFEIEAQFINPDVTKLTQLATNSKTKLHYIDDYKTLFSDLLSNENYKTIQKETQNKLPLINWKYLLGVLLLLLTFEWLLRKYNGLI